MGQIDQQRAYHDRIYGAGSRSHIGSPDPLVRYVTHWRISEALSRLTRAVGARLTFDTPLLVLCAGEGGEGSVLCDLGFKDVTVSDISEMGVQAALSRDPRLKGLVLNAQAADLPDATFGVVLVQDGLHHLPSPIQGFTEMLRLASVAAIFLEPHDSLVGNLIGTRWEKNGEAVNYVFRWTRKLVEDVASSYLGPGAFCNLSFSFWHHNPVFARLGRKLGGGRFAIGSLRTLKVMLDGLGARWGNQFCGLVVVTRPAPTSH